MSRLRVFVVDDSIHIRSNLKKLIESNKKFRWVGESVDVPETIELIKNAKPDIVVLDYSLPSGSGIDLIEQIKSFNKKIQVIIYTQFENGRIKELSFEKGADQFFSKVSDIEKLIAFFDDSVVENREE